MRKIKITSESPGGDAYREEEEEEDLVVHGLHPGLGQLSVLPPPGRRGLQLSDSLSCISSDTDTDSLKVTPYSSSSFMIWDTI